jgi:hypothetical protein
VGGRGGGERCERVNIEQILCTCGSNGKMRPIETIPEMGNKGE